MTTTLRVAALGAMTLLALGCHTGPKLSPLNKRATVSGKVIDAASSEPLGGATLHLVPAGENANLTNGVEGGTSLSGEYALDEVPGGDYQLHVIRQGYRPWSTRLSIERNGGYRVNVAMTRVPEPCIRPIAGKTLVPCP